MSNENGDCLSSFNYKLYYNDPKILRQDYGSFLFYNLEMNISTIKKTGNYSTISNPSLIEITNICYKCKYCGKIPIISFIDKKNIKIICCIFYKDKK